jgi:hypothetical protein
MKQVDDLANWEEEDQQVTTESDTPEAESNQVAEAQTEAE